MLCGYSVLLQYVSLDYDTLRRRRVAHFANTLATHTLTARLPSLHLRGYWMWDLSSFLATNVYLRHFSFTFAITGWFTVPMSFFYSLRRNGSSHMVQIQNEQGEGPLNAVVSHFVEAFTTRNRVLPQLVKEPFKRSKDDNHPSGTSQTEAASFKAPPPINCLFPSLCQVSQQVQRAAANILLTVSGLLATCDELAGDDSAPTGDPSGKRAALSSRTQSNAKRQRRLS